MQVTDNRPAGGISLDISWLSSPCRLSQEFEKCNSPYRREAVFLGKLAASQGGNYLSKCNSWQAYAAHDATVTDAPFR
jgi:hypothetical protein